MDNTTIVTLMCLVGVMATHYMDKNIDSLKIDPTTRYTIKKIIHGGITIIMLFIGIAYFAIKELIEQ